MGLWYFGPQRLSSVSFSIVWTFSGRGLFLVFYSFLGHQIRFGVLVHSVHLLEKQPQENYLLFHRSVIFKARIVKRNNHVCRFLVRNCFRREALHGPASRRLCLEPSASSFDQLRCEELSCPESPEYLYWGWKNGRRPWNTSRHHTGSIFHGWAASEGEFSIIISLSPSAPHQHP